MAEPPCPLTDLLIAARYDDFIREMAARQLLQSESQQLKQMIAQLHAELKTQRHPPGPTVEWLLIDRLVEQRILDARVRELLS